MFGPHQLTLLDLAIALVVVFGVIGALRRGAGPLAAAAAGLAAAIVCWLLAALVIAIGPHELSSPVAHSVFAATLRPPVWAVDQLAGWVTPGPAGHHRDPDPGPVRA